MRLLQDEKHVDVMLSVCFWNSWNNVSDHSVCIVKFSIERRRYDDELYQGRS